MQGMAAFQRLRQQQAAAKAKRDAHLKELWGPIRVGSGVLLSEKASHLLPRRPNLQGHHSTRWCRHEDRR